MRVVDGATDVDPRFWAIHSSSTHQTDYVIPCGKCKFEEWDAVNCTLTKQNAQLFALQGICSLHGGVTALPEYCKAMQRHFARS